MPDDSALIEVLESLRERGALGETSLPQAISHAEAFLAAIPPTTRRVIDLGSGGGLPALVLAVRLPDVHFVLTDRRERRMDLLRLAASRLSIAERVTVLTGDVTQLARQADLAGWFDVATARAFGQPLWTLRCAVPFLSADGVIVVSEPPHTDSSQRWPTDGVSDLGLVASNEEFPSVRRFDRRLVGA